MKALDKFKLLMSEIGPVLNATSVMFFEDTHWAIAFGADDLIWVYYHQEDDSFTLSADAGVVQQKNQLELFKFFLTFNALGQETKSLKTALSGNGENCLLLAEHSAISLNTIDFSAIFFDFAEQFIHWSYLLKSWPSANGEDKQKLLENISFMNPHLIRA